MISLTSTARAALVSLLQRKNASSDQGLRLNVQKGGCAGLQYAMGVEVKQDGDHLCGDDEARVFIAPEAQEFLEGLTLDYSISLSDSGFKVINPNAERSCGCGTSFEAKGDKEKLEEAEESCDAEA